MVYVKYYRPSLANYCVLFEFLIKNSLMRKQLYSASAVISTALKLISHSHFICVVLIGWINWNLKRSHPRAGLPQRYSVAWHKPKSLPSLIRFLPGLKYGKNYFRENVAFRLLRKDGNNCAMFSRAKRITKFAIMRHAPRVRYWHIFNINN